MKKITFLFLAVFCSVLSYGQTDLPTEAGPIVVSDGTPVVVNFNDAGNSAGVPAGQYDRYSVVADWENLDFAWSSEERLSVVTAAGATTAIAPTAGAAGSTDPTTLEYGNAATPLALAGVYDPSVDGALDLNLSRTYASDAQYTNIVVTLYPAPACTAATEDLAYVTPDCSGAGSFEITVEFSDLGDATDYDDGSGPVAISGDFTAGPYNDGDSVTLTIIHSDPACNFSLGPFTNTCPAPQDTCDTAESITPGTYTTTINQGTNGSIMGVGADAAFFSYTPTEDGSIYVNSCNNGGNADTNLNIGTGPCNDLTSIAANDDSCDRGDGNAWASEITMPVTAGTTYIIEWDDRYTSGANTFDWTLEFTAAPTCIAATYDEGTINDYCNPDGTGSFTVDIEVTDDGDGSGFFVDNINFLPYPVSVGTVTVGPFNTGESVTITYQHNSDSACNGTVGTFTYTCPPPAPDNDDCANATPIVCGETINATSVGSTGNQEGSGCSIGDNGIWFTFTGTGGDMTVDVDASFDHEVALTSGACGALVNINCDDQSVGTETHTFTSTLNETYYVYVAQYISGNTTTGTVDITLTCAAIPTCTAATYDAGTINDDDCNPDGSGQWSVVINVSDVGDGGTFEDGTNSVAVVAGDVTMGPYNTGDSVTINYVNGDTDCDATVGTFNYSCPLPPPANDDAAGAYDLPVGDTLCESPVLGDNTTATDSDEADNLASCSSSDPEGDVWFKVTVPWTGEVNVETSTTGEITDTVMIIYRGTPGALVEIACDDDDADGLFSLIELTAADGISPDDVLYVRVWEYNDDFKGTFNVCAWSPSTLGVEDNTLAQFSYYPNPVKNTLTLNAQNTIEDVTMYNMLGQVVLKATPNAINTDVDMSALSNGAYFVQVTIANTTKTVRVIKQ